jgi:uncharacterized protein (DUF488 family)
VVLRVYTIGHSTRPIDGFLHLLAAHGIAAVADVRRHPASRRHPQFAREALAAALAERDVAYKWMEALGGRRSARPDSPHTAWKNDQFRGYADHMDGSEFDAALERLLALARERPTAVMCAEAVPWRCHRQLISDALVVRGIEVAHVTGSGPASLHRLSSFARLDGVRVVYDKGQLAFGAARR